MDENRLRQTLARVKSTQVKFNELSERSHELDEQLSRLPSVPEVRSRFIIATAIIFALIGVIIGIAILLI